MAAQATTAPLTAEERRELAEWIAVSRDHLPDRICSILDHLEACLTAAEGAPQRRAFDTTLRELRRAMGITPSSEKRRSSGSPFDGAPRAEPVKAKTEQEKLAEQIDRKLRLALWHLDLQETHEKKLVRLEERLAKMREKAGDGTKQEAEEPLSLDEIELTAEERARIEAAAKRSLENVLKGNGADPALKPAKETLMPRGGVVVREEKETIPATIPEELAGAQVVKTLTETRDRFDFAVTLTHYELTVEKKIVKDANGDRRVIAASTSEYGPPGYSVTWHALATLSILTALFCIPFNRLGTLLSSEAKVFDASGLSKLLRYVARRFVRIYLVLGKQIANSRHLAGDDTTCRVLDVAAYFDKVRSDPTTKPPWSDYQAPEVAKESIKKCAEEKQARIRRREDGDREAKPSDKEIPSLGMLIGAQLRFESKRRNGDGAKQAIHTTVVTGRTELEDPASTIVFYRSHLGSCGNLFEWLLEKRDKKHRELTLQGDLSTTNLVTDEKLHEHFDIRVAGCADHARRPFAIYADQDPERCAYMLHLFTGLAINEDQLDKFGRNQENVLAVRTESRELWNKIHALAKRMTEVWSKETKLGAGARYIINHFQALTAYLDDPFLEQSNSMRERMLRTEKLIQGSSMFRGKLEGRFALDVVRTILQTAVASGAPIQEYLVSVLRADEDDVDAHPEHYTPRAWVAANVKKAATATQEH